MQVESSKLRIQISFTFCDQTLVSTHYASHVRSESTRELSSLLLLVQANKKDGECVCVCNACVSGKFLNKVERQREVMYLHIGENGLQMSNTDPYFVLPESCCLKQICNYCPFHLQLLGQEPLGSSQDLVRACCVFIHHCQVS